MLHKISCQSTLRIWGCTLRCHHWIPCAWSLSDRALWCYAHVMLSNFIYIYIKKTCYLQLPVKITLCDDASTCCQNLFKPNACCFRRWMGNQSWRPGARNQVWGSRHHVQSSWQNGWGTCSHHCHQNLANFSFKGLFWNPGFETPGKHMRVGWRCNLFVLPFFWPSFWTSHALHVLNPVTNVSSHTCLSWTL